MFFSSYSYIIDFFARDVDLGICKYLFLFVSVKQRWNQIKGNRNESMNLRKGKTKGKTTFK